jgi:acetyl esterase/lipase
LAADGDRLAVTGDSAGGNLAAVVSQLARDAGGPRIAFQLRWYPATTWDTSLPSFTESVDAPILGGGAVKGLPAATEAMERGLKALREALT